VGKPSPRSLVKGRADMQMVKIQIPEPFKLLREIPVVVQPSGDEYVASFFDANVHASGCTETDAVENLKDVMLGLFAYLEGQPAKRLGPMPAKQRAVLREFIRRAE
jgi:hypothetical protein